MTFFGEIGFFALLGFLAIPAVILGLTGRPIKWYGMAATLFAVAFLLAPTPRQLVLLAGFLLGETLVMKAHLWFITRHGNTNRHERRLAVAAALAPLAVVKVTGLFDFPSLGFIGVSYLSFRAVQVIVEISDKLITEQGVLDYLYFVAFFPTLSSGPIDRSRRFLQDAGRSFSREDYLNLLGRGLWLLLLGAVYKFAASALFAGWLLKLGTGPVNTLAYMYVYSLYLFFDFAGYSLMAVGASHLFGIRTPMNFRLPFVSASIKEFWNRWHITLSFWLRDYVYTRLLMSFVRRKTFANRHAASYVALVVNMGLMGVWHGTAWYYIAYGLYHGVLLVLNDLYERKSRFYAEHKSSPWYRVAAIVVTFHLVAFGFLLFSGRLSWA